MKVSELIEKLKEVSPDSEVSTEGCDCTGDVMDVIEYEDGDVLLIRSDGREAREREKASMEENS